MWRHGQREFVAGQQNATALLVAQFQMSLKLAEGSDPVLELPFPIIPEFWRRVRPITWRVRDELFSVPIYRGKSIHFFVVDKKVKTLKYRVNAGTWPCATHMNEPANAIRNGARLGMIESQCSFLSKALCHLQQEAILAVPCEQR